MTDANLKCTIIELPLVTLAGARNSPTLRSDVIASPFDPLCGRTAPEERIEWLTYLIITSFPPGSFGFR
jgi:hypothetical protein